MSVLYKFVDANVRFENLLCSLLNQVKDMYRRATDANRTRIKRKNQNLKYDSPKYDFSFDRLWPKIESGLKKFTFFLLQKHFE